MCACIAYTLTKRKLRFDVRKKYERKRQQVSLANEVNAVQPVICPLLAATINPCDVNTLQPLSHDELPSGWTSTCISSHTNEESLALYKLQLQQPLASVNVAYMVTVSSDSSWIVYIGYKIINIPQCSRLNTFPEVISNVDELIHLLLVIDGSKHCTGNPDDKFSDLVVSHKGNFKNQQCINI